jgi:hypothetical protein
VILPTLARMLVQEHQFRPITGRVLCLGPQQVAMSKREVERLFKSRGRRAVTRTRPATSRSYVSDAYFFSRFEGVTLDSLDVVEGYGGTIIHDLNAPVPESLYEQFDFIFDGGTFDHLMQLGTAFTNVIRMLKPGGRVLHFNAASGYIGAAYVSFGPDLFYDYYVMNRFLDCRIHILRGTGPGTHEPCDVYFVPDARTKSLNSDRHQMVACLAEKAEDSTWSAVPVEYTYRSPDLRQRFADARTRVLTSKRPKIRADRPVVPVLREAVKRTRLEVAYAMERYRNGKFKWRKFKRHRRNNTAGTGYVYLGRL